MKILTVCDQGNNRSITFAHLLKYKYKADVLSVGLNTNSESTIYMLCNWADVIILTEAIQLEKIPLEFKDDKYIGNKVRIWDVGSDRYTRPFNPELLAIAKRYIAENPL